MTRHMGKYQEFQNVNIRAELVEVGGKLAVQVHVAADAPTPNGMKRFSSEQHVSLDNFIDGLRAENTSFTVDVPSIATENAPSQLAGEARQ